MTIVEQPKINPVMRATEPGYKHHKLVPMLQMHEGKELVLPMVILTSRESAEIEAKTYQDTLALFGGKVPKSDEPSNWKEMLDAQRAAWIVFYSVRHPGDLTKKWFLSKQQVEDTYTWDELDLLMNDHMTVRLTQPHLENVDPADPNAFQKVIDRIKKLGTEPDFFLNGLSTHNTNQLIKYLVAQLESLQKSNGSSIAPCDNTTTIS